jgi:hypothetical protein
LSSAQLHRVSRSVGRSVSQYFTVTRCITCVNNTGTAWYVIFFCKAVMLFNFVMFLVTLSQEWNYKKDFSAKYGLHENY